MLNIKNLGGLIIFASILALSTSSTAKTYDVVGELADVSGDVLIERNGEFLRGVSESAVISGDRVITKEGASTLIKIEDDCDNRLVEQQSVYVDDEFCEAFGTLVQAYNTPFAAPVATLNAAPPAALLLAVGSAFGVGQAGVIAAAGAGVIGATSVDAGGTNPQAPVSP